MASSCRPGISSLSTLSPVTLSFILCLDLDFYEFSVTNTFSPLECRRPNSSRRLMCGFCIVYAKASLFKLFLETFFSSLGSTETGEAYWLCMMTGRIICYLGESLDGVIVTTISCSAATSHLKASFRLDWDCWLVGLVRDLYLPTRALGIPVKVQWSSVDLERLELVILLSTCLLAD